MNHFKLAILLLLFVLGASAGVMKIMQMPQELEFFKAVGLNEPSLVVFGIAQLVGAVMLIFRRSRLPGALVSAVAFLASTIMIFMTGAFGFGSFSLLPVIVSGWIIWDTRRPNAAADG